MNDDGNDYDITIETITIHLKMQWNNKVGVSKLRLTGHIQPALLFYMARSLNPVYVCRGHMCTHMHVRTGGACMHIHVCTCARSCSFGPLRS